MELLLDLRDESSTSLDQNRSLSITRLDDHQCQIALRAGTEFAVIYQMWLDESGLRELAFFLHELSKFKSDPLEGCQWIASDGQLSIAAHGHGGSWDEWILLLVSGNSMDGDTLRSNGERAIYDWEGTLCIRMTPHAASAPYRGAADQHNLNAMIVAFACWCLTARLSASLAGMGERHEGHLRRLTRTMWRRIR